uniref:Selenoprotein S n=1 Tax=Ficedula albicollis TaxID=59894 RepID=A0A803W964_FICAL
MLLAAVAVYLLVQEVSRSLAARPSGRRGAAEAAEEPDVVVRRQEALAAARLRMQEELNAQAERYKEKQRQLEEERRRQKIAMWESMQEGKSYKGNLKLNQQEVESGASASTVPKSKPNKKPLRGGGEYGILRHSELGTGHLSSCFCSLCTYPLSFLNQVTVVFV